MLERFRVCYPTGCFISELVAIHNGKYVVRVLVQVNGEILATGLAAADTVELAEDQARKRSLAILPLDSSISTPQTTSSSQPKTSVPISQLHPPSPSTSLPRISNFVNTPVQAKTETSPPTVSNLDSNEVPHAATVSSGLEKLEIPAPLEKEVLPPVPPSIKDDDVPYSTENLSRFDDTWLDSDYGTKQKEEKMYETVEPLLYSTNERESEIATSELIDEETEIAQSTYTNDDIYSSNIPIDLSDDNAKIDILIDILSWTKEKERDFLEQNYSQKTRSFLTAEQLFDFHQYLDVMAKVTDEINLQGWKPKQQKDYLEHNHNKQSLEQLNVDELQSFLQYLEVFSKTTNEIKRLGWNANKGKSYLKENYGEEGRTRLSYEKLQDFLQNLEGL